jgi:hypothetical protein
MVMLQKSRKSPAFFYGYIEQIKREQHEVH